MKKKIVVSLEGIENHISVQELKEKIETAEIYAEEIGISDLKLKMFNDTQTDQYYMEIVGSCLETDTEFAKRVEDEERQRQRYNDEINRAKEMLKLHGFTVTK